MSCVCSRHLRKPLKLAQRTDIHTKILFETIRGKKKSFLNPPQLIF